MKDFTSWGLKIRTLKDYNYRAVWLNLKTLRFGEDGEEIKELPPEYSEFYDVGLTTRCNACCPWCYVNASKEGRDFTDICETWKRWMEHYPIERKGKVSYSLRPNQIATGSTGEPCLHPSFTQFLRTVYETNVVPNYTTNGLILSDINNPWCQEILEATSDFCGGVAISFGNKAIRSKAELAILNLLKYGNCKVMIHHLISDKESVDDFVCQTLNYGKDIHYHVLLPLMAHGRSRRGLEEGTFEYLEEQIHKYGISNIAFGANFYPYLEKSSLPVSTYPQEAYSKNVLLDGGKVTITPSSFNLKPIKIIEV